MVVVIVCLVVKKFKGQHIILPLKTVGPNRRAMINQATHINSETLKRRNKSKMGITSSVNNKKIVFQENCMYGQCT